MSRRIWGMTLAGVALVIVAAMIVWYVGRDTSTPPEEQKGTELVESLPVENAPQDAVLDADGGEENAQEVNADGYEFLLISNENSYVEVYSLPEGEIYEYTDVILDVLPQDVQEEVMRGKYLRNEEELYNFLENYTS